MREFEKSIFFSQTNLSDNQLQTSSKTKRQKYKK